MVTDRQLQSLEKWRARWLGRRSALIGLALFAAGFAYLIYFMRNGVESIAIAEVDIGVVKRRTLDYYIPIRATVKPVRRVELESNVVGRVERIHRHAGETVKAGDALVELSNPVVQLEVAGQEAEIYQQWNASLSTKHQLLASQSRIEQDIIKTQATLDDLHDQLSRQKLVQPIGGATVEEVERTERRIASNKELLQSLRRQQVVEDGIRNEHLDKLQFSLNSLQEKLDLTRRTLDSLVIHALIDGHISSLNVEVGRLLDVGDPVVTIDDRSFLALESKIDQYYLDEVRVGSRGSLVLDDQSEISVAVTNLVSSVIDGRFEATMGILDRVEHSSFVAGQAVSIRLQAADAADVLCIPVGDYLNAVDLSSLFVVNDAASVARRREVELGRRGSSYVEVLSGLAEGDRVIIGGYDGYSSSVIRLR